MKTSSNTTVFANKYMVQDADIAEEEVDSRVVNTLEFANSNHNDQR